MGNDQFLAMLKEHMGIIHKVANSYCQNADDRDDLIQEITIQLWKSWPKYNNKFKLSTWIYRIALNVAISFFRKNRKRYMHLVELQVSDQFQSQDNQNELSEDIAALYKFIAQLKPLDRALMLLYLDSISYDEMAVTLGISRTNVSTKISRLKKELKIKFHEKAD